REFGDIAEDLGLEVRYRDGVGWAPEMTETGSLTQGGSAHRVEILTSEALKHFAREISALDKVMSIWEPEAEDAARKQRRRPLSMICSCVPRRVLRASSGVALGPGIRCERCGQLFKIRPGQRVSEADRT